MDSKQVCVQDRESHHYREAVRFRAVRRQYRGRRAEGGERRDFKAKKPRFACKISPSVASALLLQVGIGKLDLAVVLCTLSWLVI